MAAGRPVDGGRVQVDQRARQQRRHHGDHQQGYRAQGEHALRVCLAAIRVALGRPDQQRHHHAGKDAAEHQVVDGVRQRVRVVVRVAEPGDADRGDQDQGAQEAGGPGDQSPERHAGAGADQVSPRGGTRCGRPRPARWWAAGSRGAAGRTRRRTGQRTISRLRISRPQVIGPWPRVIGRMIVSWPGHPAPVGRRVCRAGRARRVRWGKPRDPGRPDGGRGPAQRQRQCRLGRARAAARHRAFQRRQRVSNGTPAVARRSRLVRSRLRRARLTPGLSRARLRRRRPGVVHRPGHPVPPSGVVRCWCLSRRYPVDPYLRGQRGSRPAADAGRRGTRR